MSADTCENCEDLRRAIRRRDDVIERLEKDLRVASTEASKVPGLKREVDAFERARSRSAELSRVHEPCSEELRLCAIIDRALEVINAAKDGEPTPLASIESVLLEAEP